jgi:transcriptional regulator with XRE-family HTH domain
MNLGALLRRRRKEKGITLKTISEKAGISEGFLSQVENNVKSPSVDTLMNICQALNVKVGDVMNEASARQKLHQIIKKEWSDVDIPSAGFATRRFCSPGDREVIDSAVLFIDPGKSIPVRKDIKNSQEVICVLKGSLDLVHSEKSVILEEGDAIHVWTDPKNQEITNRGKNQAVVLWVGTL